MAKLSPEIVAGADQFNIPDGLYTMQLVEVQTEKDGKPLTTANGDVKWVWIFEFPKDANEGRWAGRKLRYTTPHTGNGARMLYSAFDAFGVPATHDTDELIKAGARSLAMIRNEEWQGTTEPKISGLRPLANGQSNVTQKSASQSSKFA